MCLFAPMMGTRRRASRREARDQARILITNPDMLHMGILPHHPNWATLFENLQWIVLDELHVYREECLAQTSPIYSGDCSEFVVSTDPIPNLP